MKTQRYIQTIPAGHYSSGSPTEEEWVNILREDEECPYHQPVALVTTEHGDNDNLDPSLDLNVGDYTDIDLRPIIIHY